MPAPTTPSSATSWQQQHVDSGLSLDGAAGTASVPLSIPLSKKAAALSQQHQVGAALSSGPVAAAQQYDGAELMQFLDLQFENQSGRLDNLFSEQLARLDLLFAEVRKGPWAANAGTHERQPAMESLSPVAVSRPSLASVGAASSGNGSELSQEFSEPFGEVIGSDPNAAEPAEPHGTFTQIQNRAPRLSTVAMVEGMHRLTAENATKVLDSQKPKCVDEEDKAQGKRMCFRLAPSGKSKASTWREGVVNLAILVNCIISGVEVDISASLPADQIPHAFELINYVFVFVYSIELALRLCGGGWKNFFCGHDVAWNLFDAFVVAVAIVEVITSIVASNIESAGGGNLSSSMRILRFVRLTRLLRGFRFLRFLKTVSSLQTLIHSLLDTSNFLFWTVVLLFLIVYLFGIALTQIVSDYCRFSAIEASANLNATPYCEEATLRKHWASLSSSMLTLFKMVTGGLDWGQAYDPVEKTSLFGAVILMLYVFFTIFALLNIVTGVFCHSAIEGANADKDIAAMLQIAKQKKYVENVRRIFTDIDDDSSNVISLAEFETALHDERMSAYLESINIPTTDAWTLFRMIDIDEDGTLDLEEFISGCMNLRGHAKAIHVAKLGLEARVSRTDIGTIKADLKALKQILTAGVGPTDPV